MARTKKRSSAGGKKCSKGKSCGGSCIARKKTCKGGQSKKRKTAPKPKKSTAGNRRVKARTRKSSINVAGKRYGGRNVRVRTR